ncbi:MAG TPA: RDD family protein [Cellulomonas sp.]
MTSTTPAPGAPPALLGRRIAAGLIDGALTSLCAAPLGATLLPVVLLPSEEGATRGAAPAPLVTGLVLLVAWAGAQWWCQGVHGWTIGRRLLGLRTLDVRTGRPLGLGRALGRFLVLALGGLVCAVGQLVVLGSILLDPTGRHRGWHDRVADAIVVDVRGLPTAERLARLAAPARVPTDGDAPTDGDVPAHGGAPEAPPAPSVPVDEEQPRTRWGTLAVDRRLDPPDLVLPPIAPGLTSDTRAIPIVLDADEEGAAQHGAGRHSLTSDDPAPDGTVRLGDGRSGPSVATAPEELRAALLFPVAEPGGPLGAARAGAAGWAVRQPDGTLLALDVPLLVGRHPDPSPGVRVLAVPDPGRSVSKTHLMIGRDDDGPWVVDRGSTNGTLVTLPDGQRIICLPDRRVRLAEGSVIAFGDHALTIDLSS